MAEYTYTVEKTCPICGEKTHVTKMKARLITLSTDEDFCVHYKDVNPYLYRVWLCEHCGFAADEKQFAEGAINPHDKAKIKDLLAGRKINLPYTEERTADEAIRGITGLAEPPTAVFSSNAACTMLLVPPLLAAGLSLVPAAGPIRRVAQCLAAGTCTT